MTETNAALLAGLPGDVRALLARPPLTDTRLLELAARWEGLTSAQARMADALRVFVVTWDPLEWRAPRPEAVEPPTRGRLRSSSTCRCGHWPRWQHSRKRQ